MTVNTFARMRRIARGLLPLLLLVCMVSNAAAVAAPSASDDATAPSLPRINSSATATVHRQPQFVEVTVGIVAQAKTASEVQSEAAKVMDTALESIRALKLINEDLKTGRVDLTPNYEYRNNYGQNEPPKIIGYSATITLTIKTTDLKSPARIIDAALAAGCNRVDGVDFGINEALEAREEATKLAIKAAKRKAEVMADALDLRIVSVLQATTTSPQQDPWWGAKMTSNIQAPQRTQHSDTDDVVVPGTIKVSVEASITFITAPK